MPVDTSKAPGEDRAWLSACCWSLPAVASTQKSRSESRQAAARIATWNHCRDRHAVAGRVGLPECYRPDELGLAWPPAAGQMDWHRGPADPRLFGPCWSSPGANPPASSKHSRASPVPRRNAGLSGVDALAGFGWEILYRGFCCGGDPLSARRSVVTPSFAYGLGHVGRTGKGAWLVLSASCSHRLCVTVSLWWLIAVHSGFRYWIFAAGGRALPEGKSSSMIIPEPLNNHHARHGDLAVPVRRACSHHLERGFAPRRFLFGVGFIFGVTQPQP